MKVILHAGSLRTGSTYLQALIWNNMPAFAHAGIFVPKTGVQSMHHYDIARATGFGYPAQRLGAEAAGGFVQELMQELAANDSETALLSSEHFDVGVSPESISRLLGALGGHDLGVVIYLRNQVDLMQSLYFEHLKWGGISDYNQFARQMLQNRTLAYDARIAYWINAGVGVRILDYNQQRADLAESFLRLLPGAPPLNRLAAPAGAVNESLSPEAMEYLRRENCKIQDHAERRCAYLTLYETLHQQASRWTKSRNLPLPVVLRNALPELTLGNRRLAEMMGEDADFLQGDLVAYDAQRAEDTHLDMTAFYHEIGQLENKPTTEQ
ncbi:hypothetical protein FNJ84_18930 [Paracoccus sp. M683]|uniref:hypothetical protein n=1 Tax=Paracoccus sp. M683 TaxID=2594268 RepID=UPI0011815A71|nr:hypothetical protein [Paracoccus sp. M683]TRW94570.1 hypothetical protein FNJ84_18930 [Paracoccus sp. M683]